MESYILWPFVMPKIRPLCTSAESSLGDRVLGEVQKNSFIALPGKAGHSRAHASKTVCLNPGWDLVRRGVADEDQGACRASGGFLMSFLKLSNCDLLWNEEC